MCDQPRCSRSHKPLVLLAWVIGTITSFGMVGQSVHAVEDPQWKPLFDGKSLDGWYVVIEDKGRVETQDVFAVSSGMIHVYPTQREGSQQPFAGLFSEQEYDNYDLCLEFKWGRKKFKPRKHAVRDAGLLYHQHGENEIWPRSAECQIQEGDTGDIWLIKVQGTSKVSSLLHGFDAQGEVKTRGKKDDYARFCRSYSWEKSGWNRVEIRVRGDAAEYYINNHLVNAVTNLSYWDKQRNDFFPLSRGRIALQVEGAKIFYRDIQIRPSQK